MDQAHRAAGSKDEQRVTTTLNRRSFLKVAGGAIGAAALSQVAPFLKGRALAQSTGPALYSLQNIGSMPPFALTTGSGQKVGLAYRAAWRQIQRTEQRFDWSLVDLAVNDAEANGVPFALSITAGLHTPTWAYDAGVQRFEFQAEDMALAMPVPWDGVYLRLWTNFMGAVGARYSTRLSRIALTGINSTTQEILLPSDPGALADFEAVGYTNTRIQQAFEEIGSKIVASFPSSVPVAGMHGNFFLPSLPGNPDTTIDLINLGVARFPNYALQNNGAVGKPRLLWQGVAEYQTHFPGRTLGLQAGAPLGATNTNDTVAQAESLGAAWLELYPPDLAFI
jgi:hypothetical protein